MQSELDTLRKLCHDNGLLINAKKTKVMHIKLPHLPSENILLKFHSTQYLHKSEMSINDDVQTIIDQVEDYKYLGIFIDHKFKLKTHVNYIHKKLQQTAYAIYHLSN